MIDHKSRSNSCESERRGLGCEEFLVFPVGRRSSPSGPALQSRTRHEGPHTAAAQHTEGQGRAALCLLLMLPLPKVSRGLLLHPLLLRLVSKMERGSFVLICVSVVLVWPPRSSHIAYFCVQSLANLLYLRNDTGSFRITFDSESSVGKGHAGVAVGISHTHRSLSALYV